LIMAKRIQIKLVRSTIGQLPEKRATVRSLGLRKIGSTNELNVNPSVLGMVAAVAHLVEVKEIE